VESSAPPNDYDMNLNEKNALHARFFCDTKCAAGKTCQENTLQATLLNQMLMISLSY